MSTNAFDYLWHQISANRPQEIEIPPGEPIYNIDLSTRIIDGPEWLGVKEDHDSELIYFKTKRYYDLIDLKDTICLVQYETINKNDGSVYKGVYAIPYYDIKTLHDSEEIILVWEIQNTLTQSATSVKYSFKFVDVDYDTKVLTYSLNTLPTTSKVLDTLNHSDLPLDDVTPEADTVSQLWKAIKDLESWQTLYWEILD